MDGIPTVSRESRAEKVPGFKHGRETHGYYRLERQIQEAIRSGRKVFSLRTKEGRALAVERQALIDAMGGIEAISPQQLMLIEDIMYLRPMIARVHGYLFALGPRIINRRSRSLVPAVKQFTSLLDSHDHKLETLGLERRARQVGLQTFMASQAEPPSEPPEGAS